MENALSVDVEEYYHALIFREATAGRPTNGFGSRVEASIARVLALLAAHDAKATFFTLGQVAADHPAMIQKISGDGHEIACHGYFHELVSGQTSYQFRADIHKAKALLEDLTGQRVVGYRAPNFSIGSTQGWAYDVLLEEEFLYDSSIYPILHDRYGDRAAPRFPYEVRRRGEARLIQFPIGTVRLFGVNLPIGGGGYFRLLPTALTCIGIRRVNSREGRPIMFYFHPWELDEDQPRPAMSWRHRFRHYVGIQREAAKLADLLRSFRFTTARKVLGL